MTTQRSWTERCYRAALLIFPLDFRARFSDEMIDFARERERHARAQGRFALARLNAHLLFDLAAAAPGVWLRRDASDADLPRDNMDILRQDLRFAIRALIRRPGFTAVAALTLALGIGANTAIFSVVDAVLIRPLPFPHADRLVVVNGVQGTQVGQGVSYADYVDWRRLNRSFEELGTYRGQSVNLTGGDAPDRLFGAFVSASFLRVMGPSIPRGRAFTDAETDVATSAPIAILSSEAVAIALRRRSGDSRKAARAQRHDVHGRRRHGAEASHRVRLGSRRHGADRLLPERERARARHARRQRGRPAQVRRHDRRGAARFVRDRKAARRRLLHHERWHRRGSRFAERNGRGPESIAAVDSARRGCRRAAHRVRERRQSAARARRVARRELSVRAAIGAGRQRIAQQLLTESIVLALLGGVISVALAAGLTKGIVALIGNQLPVDPTTIGLDGRVLVFTLTISILTGILFGLPPALKASRADLGDTLRSRLGAGAGHRVTRNVLVVVQLALSLTLLAAAGLLTRSLIALQHVNPGFDGSQLLTAQFRLPAGEIQLARQDHGDVRSQRRRASRDSGRRGRGARSRVATERKRRDVSRRIEGKAAVLPGMRRRFNSTALRRAISPRCEFPCSWDATSRRPIDSERPPVVIVNRAFASDQWPDQSAIGKRIRMGDSTWRTIIGVAGDTRHFSLNEHQLFQAYVPHAQRPQIFTSLVVRAKSGDPLLLGRSVREAIWRVDRDQPIWRFRSMEQDLASSVASSKATMWLTGLFAVVALLVATVGIYGVLSYTMAQRTQEVGIRIALGADARQVTRMVIGDGLRVIARRDRRRARRLARCRRDGCARRSTEWDRTTSSRSAR